MADRIAVMNHGKLEQVGTPAELYERPANPFVAGFLGETNLLDGTLTDVRGDCWTVALDGGTIVQAIPSQAARHGRSPGTPVRVAVRPERVRLDAPGNGMIDGTVGDVIYAGPTLIYLVHCDGLPEFTVRVPVQDGTPRRSRGDAVALVWEPAHALLY